MSVTYINLLLILSVLSRKSCSVAIVALCHLLVYSVWPAAIGDSDFAASLDASFDSSDLFGLDRSLRVDGSTLLAGDVFLRVYPDVLVRHLLGR